MYNPFKYWSKRTNPNTKNPTNYVEAKYLPPFLEGAKTLLDYGIGVGRTLKHYKGLKVTGLDIVYTYKDEVSERAKKLGLEFKHLVEDKPTFKKRFDVAVTCRVLLHVPPEDLEPTLKYLGERAKKVLLISYYSAQEEKLAAHVFKHKYEEAIVNIGGTILQVNQEKEAKQIIVEYEL